MNLSENKFHIFVIEVWLEETVEETGRALWRARITHAVSKKKDIFRI